MTELVFLLEEPSAQAAIEGLLGKLLTEGMQVQIRYIPFQGKQDLERQLVRKLHGYRNPDARFVVLRDQDSHPDCRAIKRRLAERCVEAGRPDALVRIACRELESVYLADLAAVEKGLGLRGLAAQQNNKKFRNPDSLESPSKELAALTRGHYQKIAGSRAIAPWLDIDNTRSRSFEALINGLRQVLPPMGATG